MPSQKRVAWVTAEAMHAPRGCRLPVPAFDVGGAVQAGETRRGFEREWSQVPFGDSLILWVGVSVSDNGV